MVAFAAWGVFAAFGAPALIRSAYAERSLSVLNDMFQGRDVHTVDHYLGVWRGLAFRLTLLGLVAVLLGYWAVRNRAWIRAAFSDRDWQPATLAGSVALAGWFGWWTGAIDVGVSGAWMTSGATDPMRSGVDDLWMAPIARIPRLRWPRG